MVSDSPTVYDMAATWANEHIVYVAIILSFLYIRICQWATNDYNLYVYHFHLMYGLSNSHAKQPIFLTCRPMTAIRISELSERYNSQQLSHESHVPMIVAVSLALLVSDSMSFLKGSRRDEMLI